MPNQYKHIFLSGNVKKEKYKTAETGGGSANIPQRNRATHSENLLRQFQSIWAERQQLNQQREAEQIPTREGTYLAFKSASNHDLITKSLEDLRKNIRLLNIKEVQIDEDNIETIATVYIPRGKEKHFIDKISKYQSENNSSILFPYKEEPNTISSIIEKLGRGIQILKVKDISKKGAICTKSKIHIPIGEEDYFSSEIDKLQLGIKVNITLPNAPLVNSIEDVSIALLESMWTDRSDLIPTNYSKWCEIWININTKEQKEQDQIAEFKLTLENIGIEYKRQNVLIFPERAILLINANRNQLIELMTQSDLLAEFRAGQELAGFWTNESSIEQQAWLEDLLQRSEFIDSNVKVCVLDSGVNNGHQLLQPILSETDTLTVDEEWGTHDHELRSGHGTLMSGIAGYGELENLLSTTDNITITHNLCSVKILPPHIADATPKELWGDIVIQGIARAEIQSPDKTLIYCMAVTSPDDVNKGRPSSWSGAIDNLTFADGETKRLIIISSGNIREEEIWKNYPNSNFLASVENPAQSWNALTIGAYTKKIRLNDDDYSNYISLANEGELSPFSTTSLIWEKKWPIKPDVVFEGGNLLKAPDSSISQHEDLELLSTSKSFNIKPFDTINATSAATALASWFAAKIAHNYPNAWAETIRGLIIHSSNWNQAMINQMGVNFKKKTEIINLLKVFGYGEPNLDKALYSEESALTYIAQEIIQPFSYNSRNTPETNEIHIFNIPWPEELLLSMSEISVKLKITLSYFIEPGAGEIGWKDKYRYQSHGLRFDINNVGEEEDTFRKRINVAAREEDERISGSSGSERWVIGVNNRNNGSIHSDYWEGTAAELSTCHFIAIYPVIGWWRERKHLGKVENRTRYSLIISLETPAQDIELYTTVKNIIEIPIEIQT